MKKRILSVVMICVIALGVSACGSKKGKDTEKNVVEKEQEAKESDEAGMSDKIKGMWNDESGNYYYFHGEGEVIEYSVQDKHASLGNYSLEEKDGEFILNIAGDNPLSEYSVENKDGQIILNSEDGTSVKLSECKNKEEVENYAAYLNTQYKDEQGNVYNFSDEVNYDGYLVESKQHINGEYMLASDGKQVILSIQDSNTGEEILYNLSSAEQGIKLTDLNDGSEFLLGYL